MGPLTAAGRAATAGCRIIESLATTVERAVEGGGELLGDMTDGAGYLAKTATIHSAKLLGETWNEHGDAAEVGFSVAKEMRDQRNKYRECDQTETDRE